MYCPNCEFEIKQEVTECPICGGVLTKYPEEGTDTNDASLGSEKSSAAIGKPLDTCISNLILDAKHELDSLDSRPGSDPQPVKPYSNNLDFESMLSEETVETGQPAADPFTTDPAMFNNMPDTPQQDEEVFLLDDGPTGNDTASPFSETDTPPEIESPAGQKTPTESLFADDRLFTDETPARPESPFADDGLSIDETAASPFTPDTSLFIEEPSAQKPESPLDADVSPPRARRQQSSDLPWSLQQDASETESTGGMNFIPEAQPEKPFEVPTDAVDLMALKKTGKQPSKSAGGGSKKRLVFIMLIGVLLIGSAYALNEYFLQDSGPARIEKPVQPRMAPRTTIKKRIKPSAEAEPETLAPAADTPANTTPADVTSGSDQQQPSTTDMPEKPPAGASTDDAQQQTPKPPTKQTPGNILTEKAPGETRQESTIVPKKKPEPAVEPVQPPTSAPDKKESPSTLAYSIHVSSFKTQQYAQKQIEHLRGLGFDAYLETVDLGKKGIWHRVKVGHYATSAEAKQAIKSIQQKNPGPTPLITINR